MVIALSLLPGAAYSADERTAGPDLTRYVLVCAALLLGILGTAYLFKRFLAGTVRRRAAKRSLRVVDVLPLGGKQKLVVVRCYDRSFLLGLGEKELSSIAELDVENTPTAVDAPEPTPAAPFRSALEDEVARADPDALAPPPSPPRTPWEEGQGILA